ncbi:MAG: TniQ family protein [Acidovorax sp.]|uniref:TnsD family Tn7-like transposition protein n=1 Tax=Acidovorax sp. TaxID=1872122 RepID=UPI00391B6C66
MALYFPTPYPDEVIGSLVTRAFRHLGVARKRYLQEVLFRPNGTMSFLLPAGLQRIAELGRIPLEQLVHEHTVFPYVTAFMSNAQSHSMHLDVLSLRDIRVMTLARSARNGTAPLRFCTACAANDLAVYGETYWHRAHLLPAVYVCPIHRTRLISVDASNFWDDASIVQSRGRRSASEVCSDTEVALAVASVATLDSNWVHRDDWPLQYRATALSKGYRLPSGDVAGQQLDSDLFAFYGAPLLRKLSFVGATEAMFSWPRLMLRPAPGVPFAPLRHILLSVFLEACEVRKTKADYKLPGPKLAEFDLVDVQFAEIARIAWGEAARLGERVTVQALFVKAGIWSRFRHHRQNLPMTDSVVQLFRFSEQSERQVGQRAAWRRKTGINKPLHGDPTV